MLFLVLFWALAIIVVLGLLNYYRNPRTWNLVIGTVVFLGFLFPFSIAFDLPIDVSSVPSNIVCRPLICRPVTIYAWQWVIVRIVA